MKIKFIQLLIISILFSSCIDSSNQSVQNPKENLEKEIIKSKVKFDLKEANSLAKLPLACMQTEYPNKLNQVLGDQEDLRDPQELHPAFYGCFDWHSAVHGHWSLIKLLKLYPNLKEANSVKQKLKENISNENILRELEYFNGSHNKSFERTYGWAWLVKLAEELYTWDDPLARELEQNLKPLTDLIVERYFEFLPKLLYPIRVGEHTNTAFGLSFAWDYANTTKNSALLKAINQRARDYYSEDKNCPFDWEPSGFDFLSPCLEELDLMRRVLNQEEFNQWIIQFAPQMLSPDFTIPVGKVSDRSDGKLVHLDGLNFSRAWVLYGLANQYEQFQHLIPLADKHIEYSLPNLVDDSYEGGHWLASFALYALDSALE